jgi:chromosome segregation ATPase
VTENPERRSKRWPTGWLVLTGALLAAVIGLAIWAALLQRDQDEVNAASAARIDELEQEVAGLNRQLEEQAAAAESGAADAQAELEAAHAELEQASADLGTTGQALAESQAELERLAGEADAALAEAEEATASAQQRARAQRARAELAEACLATVADILERLYGSGGTAEALEEAAAELEDAAEDCAPAG